jgi:hypothetical protein
MSPFRRYIRWVGALVLAVAALGVGAASASADDNTPTDAPAVVQPVSDQPVAVTLLDSIWG